MFTHAYFKLPDFVSKFHLIHNTDVLITDLLQKLLQARVNQSFLIFIERIPVNHFVIKALTAAADTVTKSGGAYANARCCDAFKR